MKEQLREKIAKLWEYVEAGTDGPHTREKLALYTGMLRDLEVADAAARHNTSCSGGDAEAIANDRLGLMPLKISPTPWR